jgi:hypothetical protein
MGFVGSQEQAVIAIRRWWHVMGRAAYPNATWQGGAQVRGSVKKCVNGLRQQPPSGVPAAGRAVACIPDTMRLLA